MSFNTVFLLFFAVRTTTGDLVQYPTDLNATFGQHVILPCQTNLELPVYWYFNKEEIFYGGKVSMSFQTMFSVLSEKDGVYNLSISSANSSYIGEYVCGDDEGQGERRSAYLYVTDAVAETSVADDGGTDNSKTIIIACVAALLVVVAVLIAVVIVWRRKNRGSTKKEKRRKSSEVENIEKHADREATTKGGVDHGKMPSVADAIQLFGGSRNKQQSGKHVKTSKRSSAESKKQPKQIPQANFSRNAKKKSTVKNSLGTETQNEEEKPMLMNFHQEAGVPKVNERLHKPESTDAPKYSEPKIDNGHSLITERQKEEVLPSRPTHTTHRAPTQSGLERKPSVELVALPEAKSVADSEESAVDTTKQESTDAPKYSEPTHTTHRAPTQSGLERKPSVELVALPEAKSVGLHLQNVADSGERSVDTTKQGQIADSSLTTETQPESKLSIGSMVKPENESLLASIARTPEHGQALKVNPMNKPTVPAKPAKPATIQTHSKNEIHVTPTTPFPATKRVDDSESGNSQMPSDGSSVANDSTSIASPGNDLQSGSGFMTRNA